MFNDEGVTTTFFEIDVTNIEQTFIKEFSQAGLEMVANHFANYYDSLLSVSSEKVKHILESSKGILYSNLLKILLMRNFSGRRDNFRKPMGKIDASNKNNIVDTAKYINSEEEVDQLVFFFLRGTIHDLFIFSNLTYAAVKGTIDEFSSLIPEIEEICKKYDIKWKSRIYLYAYYFELKHNVAPKIALSKANDCVKITDDDPDLDYYDGYKTWKNSNKDKGILRDIESIINTQ